MIRLRGTWRVDYKLLVGLGQEIGMDLRVAHVAQATRGFAEFTPIAHVNEEVVTPRVVLQFLFE